MSLAHRDLPRREAGAPQGAERVLAFGPFRLDPAERLLMRDGQPVPLTPKAFDLLVYLAERPGRLVEKATLMAALWPDAAVEESNLAYTVSALRKALGAGHDGDEVIQTVPTRGYRWVARVQEAAPAEPANRAAGLRWRPVAGALILLAAGAVAVAVMTGRRSRPLEGDTPRRVVRFELPAAVDPRHATAPAVSPDGRRIAFSDRSGRRRQLFLRSLDTLEVVPIPGAFGSGSPFFSPDGRTIAYCRGIGAGFAAVDVATGAVTDLAGAGCTLTGATWAPDGRIYFSRQAPAGLGAIPAAGGAAVSLTRLGDGEVAHEWPQMLPGLRHLLFGVRRSERLDDVDAQVLTIATGERRTVLKGSGARTMFAASGHLVYSQGSTLLAVAFDVASLQVRGRPSRILDDVAVAPLTAFTEPAPLVGVAEAGTLVYNRGGVLADPTGIAWHGGDTATAAPVGAPAGLYVDPSLSPDGRRLAVSASFGAYQQDIWAHDFERRTWTRVTSDPRIESAPIWHPLDPERLIFTAVGESSETGYDLMTIRADGSGRPELLYASPRQKHASSVSAAARLVAFVELSDHSFDIWLLDLNGKPTARPFLQTRFAETCPALSPDGRWMAYDSNESGERQVYVRPLSGEGRWPISSDGGARPRWSRDGRTLVYRRLRTAEEPPGPDRMMAVTVAPGTTFVASQPRVVAEGSFSPGGTATANYDISADGRRILLITRAPQAPRLPLVVVENWFTELRQKVGQ